MNWVRTGVVALVMLAVLLPANLVAAQDGNGPTISPVVQAEDEVDDAQDIDFDKNQAEIDRARRILIAIAVVMAVALIAYWWHTVPSRRLRVATKRLADHRAMTPPSGSDAAPVEPNSGSIDRG